MAAYGNLTNAIAGLLYGNTPRKVESWAAAETINFGAPCFTYAGEDYAPGDGKVWNVKQDISTITLDADLVASNVITTTLTIDGVAQTPVATTFATDHDTTMAAHAAALETAFSGLSATVTAARVITLFHKGYNLTTVASVVTLGASQAGITIAYSNGQVFVGTAIYIPTSTVANVGRYNAYEQVSVLTDGQMWVNAYGAVNAAAKAYVIWLATNQGYFSGTSTDNYDTGCWFKKTLAATGLTVVEVRGMHIDATP